MSTMNREINKLQKIIRAEVIKNYLYSIGQNTCVCFTCGNASKYLRAKGLNVVEVIEPGRWWDFAEIQQAYKMFDATSGHLPLPLMQKIALELRKYATNNKKLYEIASGSGETIITLQMAFPEQSFKPIYNIDKATQYNELAPLNSLVASLKH